jgi:DHA1 family bicyclomycin/chloramphenicol resistance-like MFS transporter
VHFTLAFTVSLSAVAIDVSLPAIPDAVSYFNAADSYGQQIVAIYLAGYAIAQIPIGLIADRCGRLPVFYAGIGLFIIASIATVLADTMQTLLWARFIQGIAGASGPVLARTIARDITDGKALAQLTSLLVTSLAVSTFVAPIVGSVLIAIWGWRATFVLVLVMGVFALIFVRRFLWETHKYQPWGESIWQQFLQSARVFLQTPQSVWGGALIGLTFFGYMGIVAGISQVLVDVYAMTSVHVGFVFASALFFYVSSAQLGRLALKKFNSMQLIKFGISGYAVTALICSTIMIFDLGSFWLLWWSLIPFLIGMGLVFSNGTAITLAPLPKVAGFAASILGTSQILFSTIGAALTGIFYAQTSDSLIVVLFLGSALTVVVFFLGYRRF